MLIKKNKSEVFLHQNAIKCDKREMSSLSARYNMKEADSKGQLFFHLSSCPVAE